MLDIIMSTCTQCNHKTANISPSSQVVCQKVFKKEWLPTILQDPPSNIKAQLEKLVDDACTNSELSPNSPQRLLDSMRNLLLSSI